MRLFLLHCLTSLYENTSIRFSTCFRDKRKEEPRENCFLYSSGGGEGLQEVMKVDMFVCKSEIREMLATGLCSNDRWRSENCEESKITEI